MKSSKQQNSNYDGLGYGLSQLFGTISDSATEQSEVPVPGVGKGLSALFGITQPELPINDPEKGKEDNG